MLNNFANSNEDRFHQWLDQYKIQSVKGKSCTTSTHWLANQQKANYKVPFDRMEELYRLFLACKQRPALTEKIRNTSVFYAFFDFDYKLDAFVQAKFFDNRSVTQWFITQQTVSLNSIENVLNRCTNTAFEVEFSVRTPYKYHVHVRDLIVNSKQMKVIRQMLLQNIREDPEYEEGPQPLEDIIDEKVYTTGLRVLGANKGTMTDSGKVAQEKKDHQHLFGDLHTYSAIYPTVVGQGELTLEVMKNYSLLLDPETAQINVTVPDSDCNPRKKRKGNDGAVEKIDVLETLRSNEEELVDQTPEEEQLMASVASLIQRPQIKSRRMLNQYTKCLVLVEQPCYFKGGVHTRSHRQQDTMWILMTRCYAELRCYACRHKPSKVLHEYNPPIKRMEVSLQLRTPDSVAQVVFEYVKDEMSAIRQNARGLEYFHYDYDFNVWRPDQFFLYEFISCYEDRLSRAYMDMVFPEDKRDEKQKDRLSLLRLLGTVAFRNSVMDMVGRKLIRKWYVELGNVYFDQKLNQNRHLCIFENGTFDFRTMEFRLGSPADCSTISTEQRYMPLYSHPREKILKLIKFLSEIFPEEEELDAVMSKIANMLDPSSREELVLVFWGRGANGKTAMSNLIVRAFGGYAGTSAQAMLTQPPPDSQKPREDIMSIRNSRALCFTELTGTLVLATLKALSGLDRWSARSNNASMMDFYLHFIMIILTNEIPRITAGAADNGTWRRLFFVYFRSTFVARKEQIRNKYNFVGIPTAQFHQLQEEIAPVFISLLIEYKKEGKIYATPPAFQQELEKIKSKNSCYSRFIDEFVQFPPIDPVTGKYLIEEQCPRTTRIAMFQAFTQWNKYRRANANIDMDKFTDHIDEIFSTRNPILPTIWDTESHSQAYPVHIRPMMHYSEAKKNV